MLQSPLRSPLNAVVKDVVAHPGNNNARRSDIYKAIFALVEDIGYYHWVNDAINFNKAAGVWGMASGWTPEQLALCMAFQDSARTIPVYDKEQPCGALLDLRYKPGTFVGGITPGVHYSQSDNAKRPTATARVNQLIGTEVLSTQSVTTIVDSYKLLFTGAGSVTLSGTAAGVYTAGTHTIACTAGTLTLTVAGNVTKAQLCYSVDADMPYQRVTTPTDYYDVGFPYYLSANGTNQCMSHPALDLTSTDEVTVWHSVLKLSDAAPGVLFELSPTINSNLGSMAVYAPTSAATSTLGFVSKGTTASFFNKIGVVAPNKNSLVVASKISAPILNCYIADASIAAQTTTQGTGNYGNHQGFLFTRNQSSLFFKGRWYGGGLIGKLQSDAKISAISKRMMKDAKQ